MFSITLAPLAVSEADSATADMNNPSFTWVAVIPLKVETPHVFDNLFVRGTNAEEVEAAASKSAERMETFLKNSILVSVECPLLVNFSAEIKL